MQTLLIVILILVVLSAFGVFRVHSARLRLVLIVLTIGLLILAIVGFMRDEQAVGPGVAPIIQEPR